MPTLYSHGDPTDAEQYLLELINRARSDPPAEATRHGIDHNEGPPVKLIPPDPVPPLPFNQFLMKAATGQSQAVLDLWLGGSFPADPHKVGGDFKPRIIAASYPHSSFTGAENIDHGNPASSDQQTIDDTHEGLFIDKGDPERGHRRSMFGHYSEVGIGMREQDGKVVTTEDFAGLFPGPKWILGVVYADWDGTGFYSPGTGIQGVTVTLSQGDIYAVTSASGGYAIPVERLTGSVTVTFKWLGFKMSTHTVQLSDQSVKVDDRYSRLVYLVILLWDVLMSIAAMITGRSRRGG
jgi:hypothetical protein